MGEKEGESMKNYKKRLELRTVKNSFLIPGLHGASPEPGHGRAPQLLHRRGVPLPRPPGPVHPAVPVQRPHHPQLFPELRDLLPGGGDLPHGGLQLLLGRLEEGEEDGGAVKGKR